MKKVNPGEIRITVLFLGLENPSCPGIEKDQTLLPLGPLKGKDLPCPNLTSG